MKHVLAIAVLGVCVAHGAWAQSLCTSDGRAAPATLVEHFVSADCEACWGAPQSGPARPRSIRLDWIVPGLQGDDAPLAAIASRDALLRLEALGRTAPDTSLVASSKVLRNRAHRVRVAQGPAVGAYIGSIIELRTDHPIRPQEPLSAWLLLVESVAAGSEGTTVQRNVVRNVLVSTWSKPDRSSPEGRYFFHELRPLSIPEGAQAQRLRVVGWVQDARGRVLGAAESACARPIDAN